MDCVIFCTRMSSNKGDHHQTVPLSVLLKRESDHDKVDKLEISYGQANHSKKGEDFTFWKTECEHVLGDDVTTFHVFAVRLFLSFSFSIGLDDACLFLLFI